MKHRLVGDKLKMEMLDALINGVLEMMPEFWDNPNGGHVYTCPFCRASKEVKATQSVYTAELNHDEGCSYKIAQELYKMREQLKLIFMETENSNTVVCKNCGEVHVKVGGCCWIRCKCGERICEECGSTNIIDMNIDEDDELAEYWCCLRCDDCGTKGCGDCIYKKLT